MIDKQMSTRVMHRVKSIEHTSGNLICTSKCDVVSDLYCNKIECADTRDLFLQTWSHNYNVKVYTHNILCLAGEAYVCT